MRMRPWRWLAASEALWRAERVGGEGGGSKVASVSMRRGGTLRRATKVLAMPNPGGMVVGMRAKAPVGLYSGDLGVGEGRDRADTGGTVEGLVSLAKTTRVQLWSG
uniref:Uncharacterized protein n=1 Tax=Arundo donax TaxID=35708 RepID=A0A0A8XP73_ARUDO